MAFNPLVKRIERARWRVVNFDAGRMGEIGQAVARSVIDRIRAGLDITDSPAAALSPGYARRKQIRGRRPIRDWIFSGRTLAALHVVKAGSSQAIIGFTDPRAERNAYYNNARAKQFGMSPKDMAEFRKVVRSKPIIEIPLET